MARSVFDPGATLVNGDKLSPADQRVVLSCFVHRYTGDHKPAWTRKPWKDGKPYPVQFASDREWLANTRFAIKADGSLDQRYSDCWSSATWPDNPELRRAYR